MSTCTVTCHESDLESVFLMNISDKTKIKIMESIITIGNPTDKRVWYFLNHWYQRVGRCVLLNHHEWRECNDRNEWWFSRTHRPTSWLKWFRKYHTSLRWDFLLIQGLKPWIIRFDFSLIQHDFSWFRVISSWFQLIQGDFSWFRMISIWFHV